MKKVFFVIVIGCTQALYAQHVGIGTTTPGTNLHVLVAPSGYVGGYFEGTTIESNYNAYLNLIIPDIFESGILFGKASDLVSGGIVYNNFATNNGMQFRTNGNITQMAILSNGKVGIGTINPTEKFQVSGGNVMADNFIYSTPKTFYYSVSGADFRSERSFDTSYVGAGNGGVYMENRTTAQQNLVGGVHLPDGAKLVKATAYISDFFVPINLRVALYRRTLATNFQADALIYIYSSGSSGLGSYQVPFNPGILEVNNSLYNYYFYITPDPIGSIWGSSGLDLRGIVIEYTLASTH